ncbi:MAG: glucose-6-phosphate isomerase [Gammaproteobacteria bacterium]
MTTTTATSTWQQLQAHAETLKTQHMRTLFKEDSHRFEKFSVRFNNDFLFDFSKNLLTEETLELLLQLTNEAQIKNAIDAMFAGEAINNTENRPVLHAALRNRKNTPIMVNGEDIMPQINDTLARMKKISHAVHSGTWKGYNGQPIKTIINIGIGGSDLGPKMVVDALQHCAHNHLTCHFVSNVDGTAITRALKDASPESTLFIIASKTFTTQETLANAHAARNWLLQHTDISQVNKHMLAVTSHPDRATAFGVAKENVLPMWDWVGGRYSLWSAIGLPIAITLGMDNFEKLLDGAYAMDLHLRTAKFRQNLPVLLGLIGVWNHNFLNYSSNAILPYCDALRYFPEHLQQVEMESNGKCTTRDGKSISGFQTSPVLWGTVGTNGQHSFHQLLHQGTAKTWCDFILPIEPVDPVENQHEMLAANCFAQSQALMQGKTENEAYQELIQNNMDDQEAKTLAPHKVIPGNKPNNTILMKTLSPWHLGALIALYEHKIFVQSVIWNINAFDQWGVELGKQLASALLPAISSNKVNDDWDSSTKGLLQAFQNGK